MVNLKTYASSGKADTSGFVPYTGGTADIVIAHDIKIDSDSKKLILGDGQDASIYYDGSNLYILADDVGTGIVKLSTDMALRDAKKVLFGTGNDSSIEDDGTNMKINTDEQSAGPTTDTRNLEITGAVVNDIITWADGAGNATAAGSNVFHMPIAGRNYTVSTITDGTAGQIITLIGNVGADVTLNELGNIKLGILTTRIITQYDTWQGVYDGSYWCEIGYSNNQ